MHVQRRVGRTGVWRLATVSLTFLIALALVLPATSTASAPPTPRYCKAKQKAFQTWKTSLLPDGAVAATEYPRSVWGMGPWLWDVDVAVSVSHTRSSDVEIYLAAPDGTRVLLTHNNGGTSDNIFDPMTFDDQEGSSVAEAGSLFTFDSSSTYMYYYNPQGALNKLTGIDPNGTWNLRVRDDAAGETGRLEWFSLTITTCGRAPDAQKTKQVSRGDTVSLTDAPSVGWSGDVDSTLTVPAMTGVLCDAQITTHVNHPNPEQLDLLVMPPSRRISMLTERHSFGVPTSFDNFTWTDHALVPLTDYSVTLGYIPTSAIPTVSLARGNGFAASGTWKLRVADLVPGVTGSMHGWSLTVETCAWTKPSMKLNLKLGSKLLTACGKTMANPCRVRRSAAPAARLVFTPAGAHSVKLAVSRKAAGRWKAHQAGTITTTAQGIGTLAIKRPMGTGLHRAVASFAGDDSSTAARPVTTYWQVVA